VNSGNPTDNPLPPRLRIKALMRAAATLAAGTLLGLALLEVVLYINPSLLLPGMAVPSPSDPRLEVREYDVRLSDADVFFWMPDRIRPISPEGDAVEARVRFETDELGFANAAPLPDEVDVVVLGRSYSLGAQAETPWPRLLVKRYGWRVMNLSQPGSGLDTKLSYLRRFGLPRNPTWVVLEVLPSMDVLGYEDTPALVVRRLVAPVVRESFRRLEVAASPVSAPPMYPIALSLPGGDQELVFFDHYVSAVSAGRGDITVSRSWSLFQDDLREMIDLVHEAGSCMAMLYAPTNVEIYFSLAGEADQLLPVVEGLPIWHLNGRGELALDRTTDPDVETLRSRVFVMRDLLREVAREQGLVFIDPTDAMIEAVLAGPTPFMRYDTHWSAVGLEIVASLVDNGLADANCP